MGRPYCRSHCDGSRSHGIWRCDTACHDRRLSRMATCVIDILSRTVCRHDHHRTSIFEYSQIRSGFWTLFESLSRHGRTLLADRVARLCPRSCLYFWIRIANRPVGWSGDDGRHVILLAAVKKSICPAVTIRRPMPSSHALDDPGSNLRWTQIVRIDKKISNRFIPWLTALQQNANFIDSPLSRQVRALTFSLRILR